MFLARATRGRQWALLCSIAVGIQIALETETETDMFVGGSDGDPDSR